MPVYAEQFFVEQSFAYSVIMIQRRLRTPANKNRAGDVGLCKLKDIFKLRPIFDFFKIDGFHGRARNDHAVKFAVSDFAERFIKPFKMFERRIFARIRFRTD